MTNEQKSRAKPLTLCAMPFEEAGGDAIERETLLRMGWVLRPTGARMWGSGMGRHCFIDGQLFIRS